MKDPAFLFYSSDFLIGTALLSDAEVGQYIKILCYMHQHKGKLCPADLKHLFPNVSEKLLEKFKRDEYGCYYHARLLKEMDKRKNFTDSRRNSLNIDNNDSVHIYLMYDSFSGNYKIGSSKYPKLRLKEMNKKNENISIYWFSENLVIRSIEKELHQEFKSLKIHNDWFKLSEKDLTNIKNKIIFHRTDNRTENENEIDSINSNSFEKSEKLLMQFPDEKSLTLELREVTIGAAIQLFKLSKGIDTTKENVLGFWTVFKKQNFTGKKFYQNTGDIYSHFLNWLNTKNISNVKGNHYNTKPTFTDKVAENNRYFEQFGENGSSGEG